MLIGFLAEPALLMVLFSASLIPKSTSLTTIVETLAHRELAIYPSLAFAGVAFTMISLAENARVPVDNPATHLELTMIHEAMVLEYAGPELALVTLGEAMRLGLLLSLVANLFFPWGIATSGNVLWLAAGLAVLAAKTAALAGVIAVLEVSMAKLRLFRVPEILSAAFVLAVLAVITGLVVTP
jgi:formate hydrogenlyase subunit 4